MCPDSGLSGDIVAQWNRQRRSQSLWVLQWSAARSVPQRKIPESLAAQTTGFGDDQTRAPPVDWLWRGVMLRMVRLAMETIIFSR